MPQPPRPTLLVATDIYGHTPETQALADALQERAVIVSPYGGERQRFADQQEAYAAFTARTNIAAYADELRRVMAAAPPFDLALGFSVGASALWLCLAEENSFLPHRAVLYYGSRIRNHADLTPCRPTRLVFAEQEASFDAVVLARRLAAAGLKAAVIPGSAHGFMNALSPGFDAALYARELERLRLLLA